jgi:hypothetical protein
MATRRRSLRLPGGLVHFAYAGIFRVKKSPRPCGCGLNPIQGELEETGVIIVRRIIFVFFIVVITDIHKNNIWPEMKSPRGLRCAGWCLLHPGMDFF